jgi:hypothetical protein
MLTVYLLSMVAGIILSVVNDTVQQDAAGQAGLLLGFSAFMVVGALIVAHRPGNAIGWIFSAVGLLALTGQLAVEYATYAYVTRPRLTARRDPGRLVWLVVLVSDHRSGAGVHSVVVPDRPAALVPLAAGRLAGRGGDGGLDGLGGPPGRVGLGR